MKHALAALAIALALPAAAVAGPATDSLSACLADNTSGKERKQLARWIFVAIAAHPEMKDITNPAPELRQSVYRETGNMVTRLIADNCPREARAAVVQDGPKAFETAFGVLGRLAMQELMGNAEVNAAVGGFEQYLDRARLEATFAKP
jgi:hypothetical protein